MKKIAYHYAILACLAALIGFTLSCRKMEKEVFEKPAAERIQQGINSLREKLKASPQGWSISYKPSSTETGTYQFLFRFVNDTEVETASDFSRDELDWKKSEYSILIGSTTKLSFATAGALHKLSDPDFSPIPDSQGSGLKGDFEFLYYGEDAQGNLVFRTNRENETLLFKKAVKNSLDGIKASYGNFEKLSKEKTIRRSLIESKKGQIWKSQVVFLYGLRVVNIQKEVQKEIDGKMTKDFEDDYTTGYGLTPEGIFLDSVRRNNGQILKNIRLKYNGNTNRFETTFGDGTLLAIDDTGAARVPVDGLKKFLDPSLTRGLKFIYNGGYNGYDVADLTTPAFRAIMDKIRPIGLSDPAIFSIYRQVAYDDVNKIDYIILEGTASVGDGNIRERLVYEDKGGRLVITRQGGFVDEESRVKPENEALYNEFMDFLTDPQGFYVKNWGKGFYWINNLFTLTSVRDPSIQVGFYHSWPNL